jgi:GNAT superfamily N-acetyltransferase
MRVEVRGAVADDWATIVDFNCRLAEESEGLLLDRETVTAGVKALLADKSRGRYLVACAGQEIVGQLMHTREWSDWRNGDLWWLQSVYVAPAWRRQGIFRSLFEYLAEEARTQTNPRVVGLRLYVEKHNSSAEQVYLNLGLQDAGYHVLERLHTVEKSHRLR